jgi:hypothetical protein
VGPQVYIDTLFGSRGFNGSFDLDLELNRINSGRELIVSVVSVARKAKDLPSYKVFLEETQLEVHASEKDDNV